MILEACIENVTYLKDVIHAGATRIELCDNLAVGGTTVSMAVRDYAKFICDSNDVELAVMIRVRGGDFVYNNIEKSIMYNDLKEMAKQGVKRAVIGAVTESGELDKAFEIWQKLVKIKAVSYRYFDYDDPKYKEFYKSRK